MSINDMLPNEDFKVGVYRTIEDLNKRGFTRDGMIFRSNDQILVSTGGAMQLIVIEKDKEQPTFSFKGLPKYVEPGDNKTSSQIVVETVNTVKSTVTRNTRSMSGESLVINNRVQSTVQQGQTENTSNVFTDVNRSQTTSQTVQQAPPTEVGSSHQATPPQGAASTAPLPVQQSEQQTSTEMVDQYSDEAYKNAIEAANLDMNDVINQLAAKGVAPENIKKLNEMKKELKEAYSDGNEYAFIVTYNKQGKPTTGLVEKGVVKFTSEDWETQSDFIKTFK